MGTLFSRLEHHSFAVVMAVEIRSFSGETSGVADLARDTFQANPFDDLLAIDWLS